MPEKDGPRRLGRYISQKNPLFLKLKIQNYYFDTDFPFVLLDNPGINILHARLHDPKEIKRGILNHPTMDEHLVEKQPIIHPRDFTEEWLEIRRRARRRGKNGEDEDEDEDEIYEKKETAVAKDEISSQDPHLEEQNCEPDVQSFEQSQSGSEIDPSDTGEETFISSQSDTQDQQHQNYETKIQELTTSLEILKKQFEETKDSLKFWKEKTEKLEQSQKTDQSNYENKLQELESLLSKKDTFLQEAEKIKKNFFKTAQEDMREVLEALAQWLLNREVQVKPELLENVLRKVEEMEKIEGGTLYVHPEMKKVLRGEKWKSLEEDSHLAQDGFRWEHPEKRFSGSITQIVHDLLEKTPFPLIEGDHD